MLDRRELESIPDFTQNKNVQVTVGYNNEPVLPFIENKYNNNPPSALKQSEFDTLVKNLKECAAKSGSVITCPKEKYYVDQYLKLEDMTKEGLILGGNSSGPIRTTEDVESQQRQAEIEEAQAPAASENELDSNIIFSNGRTGLGTLLVPYLYIRWGTTVLHNSFPEFSLDKKTPQIRQNISALEITMGNSSGGGEETGGSGSSGSGTTECSLTLNPQLVDHEGKPITVKTDGAELLVIWGYPNSNQIRSHTFAQVGIKDKFYNEQQTTVLFRGREWRVTRISEQKRYGSGPWRQKVLDAALEVCKEAGYEQETCKINLTPADFGGDLEVGETDQSGSPTDYLTRLVEKTAGCKITYVNNDNATTDVDRGVFKIAIDCASDLGQENPAKVEIDLVDRALWLGQGLAEVIELSDVGDTASDSSNTGGNCGSRRRRRRRRNTRPENSVLKSFKKGCDYILVKPNQIQNTAGNRDNEYLLELTLEDEVNIPILAPFEGKVTAAGPATVCPSTNTREDCGPDQRGNFITLEIEDASIENQFQGFKWTFYHLSAVKLTVGAKFNAGDVIGTQGKSGSIEVEATGIKIEDKSGDKVDAASSRSAIDDYIRTITFPCDQGGGGSGCKIPYITSNKPGSGAPYHMHIEAATLDLAIQAMDNMSDSDPETCYNVNNIENGVKNVGRKGKFACWDSSWTPEEKKEVYQVCSKSHQRSTPRFNACDYFIFDKNEETLKDPVGKGRAPGAATNTKYGRDFRWNGNPFPTPDWSWVASVTTEAIGFRFFKTGDAKPTSYYPRVTNGPAQVPTLMVQLFHGDIPRAVQEGIVPSASHGAEGKIYKGCEGFEPSGEIGGGSLYYYVDEDGSGGSNFGGNDQLVANAVYKHLVDRGLHVRIPPQDADSSEYATNIVGIRGINPDLTLNDNKLDEWNDLYVLFGINNKKDVRPYLVAKGTTDASKYWTTSSGARSDGPPFIIPDQSYKDVWTEGAHSPPGYPVIEPALIARTGRGMPIVRDRNKSGTLDPNEQNSTVEYNGSINMHHGRDAGEASIGKSSAGCQVIRATSDWAKAVEAWQSDYLYRRANTQAAKRQVKFDYVLLLGETLFNYLEQNNDASGNEFLDSNSSSAVTGDNVTRTQEGNDTLIKANFGHIKKANGGTIPTVTDASTPSKFVFAAGHESERRDGAGTKNAVFRGERLISEKIMNILVAEAIAARGRDLGYDCSVITASFDSDGGRDLGSMYDRYKKMVEAQQTGAFAIEFHHDRADSKGREGLIHCRNSDGGKFCNNNPSSDHRIPTSSYPGTKFSTYHERLAREYGSYSAKGEKDGYGGPNRGVAILELGPTFGRNEDIIIDFVKSGKVTKQYKELMEAYVTRFWRTIQAGGVAESSGNSSEERCGPPGQYKNLTKENADKLNKLCEKEGCNPQDVALFIQQESDWRTDNSNGCFGYFQCCPPRGRGGAPQAKMAQIIRTIPTSEGGGTWFNKCADLHGQSFERQMAGWKAYRQATASGFGEVPFTNVCALYMQIALPAFVKELVANKDQLLKDACSKSGISDGECRSYFKGNQDTWFKGKTYETAQLKGVCEYLARGAVKDPRLDGGCTIFGSGPATGGNNRSNVCGSDSNNRNLNSRNTGTLSSGGLQDLKFREEIRLNAEFGINPRNLFLSPTSPKGDPQYILLANMDNSPGGIDFKIRSVTLTWRGHWRWNVTAFRPASEANFQIPRTLRQPRSHDEWINYYWFPNLFTEAANFAPAGTSADISRDGLILNPVANTGTEAVRDRPRELIEEIFSLVSQDNSENEGEDTYTVETVTRLKEISDVLDTECNTIVPACLKLIETKLDSVADEIKEKELQIDEDTNPVNFETYIKERYIDKYREVADGAVDIQN